MRFLQALRRRLGLKQALPELNSVAAYRLWAAAYPPEAHNRLMEAEENAVSALLPEFHGQKVLDVGSGTGRYGGILRDAGAANIVGLDNSPAMLSRNLMPQKVLATVEALPLVSGSFDGIVCGLVLGHLPDISVALAELERVLRPGGWLVLSDFHPYLARRGMQRSFVAPGGVQYAVEHYVHDREAYEAVGLGLGLAMVRCLEPTIVSADGTTSGPAVLALHFAKASD